MTISLSRHQLKVLILYTLSVSYSPMPRMAIENVLACCDANIFEIQLAIADLISMSNLSEMKDEDEAYLVLTEQGRLIVDPLKKDVPISIREKAASLAMVEMTRQRQSIGVEADVIPVKHGQEEYYTSNLALNDDGQALLQLTLFTPNRIQAELVAKNFRKDPNGIYKEILKILTRTEPA